MIPIYAKLPKRNIDIKYRKHYKPIKRVLFTNPSRYYKRSLVNPLKRHNTIFSDNILPSKGKLCACGCGKALTGRRRRWATNDCAIYVWYVTCILSGRTNEIRRLIGSYYGFACVQCGDTENLELDHIVPVYAGGGGCWLNNYQFLCRSCHKSKTANDRKIY